MEWLKDRRLRKRYRVHWKGILKLKTPDFRTETVVVIEDFSSLGARLYSSHICIDGQYLITAECEDDLTLELFSPHGRWETSVSVQWYKWAVDRNVFEIGVKFFRLSPGNQKVVEKLLKELARRPVTIYRSPDKTNHHLL